MTTFLLSVGETLPRIENMVASALCQRVGCGALFSLFLVLFTLLVFFFSFF